MLDSLQVLLVLPRGLQPLYIGWPCTSGAAMVVHGGRRYLDLPGAPLLPRLRGACMRGRGAQPVALRCPIYAAQRAALIAAVHRTMPAHVIAWAGDIADHPDTVRWVTLWLEHSWHAHT